MDLIKLYILRVLFTKAIQFFQRNSRCFAVQYYFWWSWRWGRLLLICGRKRSNIGVIIVNGIGCIGSIGSRIIWNRTSCFICHLNGFLNRSGVIWQQKEEFFPWIINELMNGGNVVYAAIQNTSGRLWDLSSFEFSTWMMIGWLLFQPSSFLSFATITNALLCHQPNTLACTLLIQWSSELVYCLLINKMHPRIMISR